MTNEEARHICKLALNCFAMKRESYLPIETQEKAISWIAEQADIRTMLEALEKQIPKKPKFIPEDNETYEMWTCGECGVFVRKYDDYCNECGQAIDWSEDDD